MGKRIPKRPKPSAGRQNQPQASAVPRWIVCAICLALAALTLVAYSRTLQAGFVNYDDGPNVYKNAWVTNGLTRADVARAFTHGSVADWDPLTTLSHDLDCQLFGLSAGGHHLDNLLLHAAAVILLFLALRGMTGALWASAFVAAVFAVHPLHVESVAWVSERKDVLSGFFFMLTLLAYARYASGPPKLSRYLMVVLWFALGLLSKAMLVTLPLVLLLLDYWPLGRLRFEASSGTPAAAGTSWRQVVVEKIPLLALSAASGVIAIVTQQHGNSIKSSGQQALSLRLENSVVSTAIYVKQLLWPVRLAAMYPFPKQGHTAWQIVLALTLVAGISIVAYCWRRSRPYFAVGWLWYLVMLLPVIGLIQFGFQAHADRYTYLPQTGLYVALTWLACAWLADRPAVRLWKGTVAILVIAALAVGTFRQSGYWHDSETLWRHAVACTDNNNAIAHYNLGVTLMEQNRYDEAFKEFQQGTDYWPDRFNLGRFLVLKGQSDQAAGQFEELLKLQPDFAPARDMLRSVAWTMATSVEASKRDGPKALEAAQELTQTDKAGNPRDWVALAAAYAENGRFDDAAKTAERARQLALSQTNLPLANAIQEQQGFYTSGRPIRTVAP